MQKRVLTRSNVNVLFYLLICVSLFACGGKKLESKDQDDQNPSPTPSFSGAITGKKVNIDLTALPEISFNSSIDTTEITLQFIPRDENNSPLAPEQVKVTLLVNDDEVGPESHVSSSSEQLAFNLNFGLVLDTSYSMLVSHGETEALTPVLQSAKNSVQKGIDLWENQEGNFTFHTTWFNSSIFSSVNTEERQWIASDIIDIPYPQDITYTRLFSATDYAIDKMAEINGDSAPGPRDQNILLIFTDGDDNYSYFNKDKDDQPIELVTENDAPYTQFGRDATSLNDLLQSIQNHENLSVHVIGLGDDINVEDLQSIAEAGNGLYLQNPDAQEIDKPFQRISREFTTLQTHGIRMPLQPGEYKFTLRVENISSKETNDYSFQFTTGDENAEILPDS